MDCAIWFLKSVCKESYSFITFILLFFLKKSVNHTLINIPKFIICQSKTTHCPDFCEIDSLVSYDYDIMVTWPNLAKVKVWFQKVGIPGTYMYAKEGY